MKKEEKLLFKSLCSFRAEEFDEKLLKYATPAVLGELFFNRMHAIAYGTLCEHKLLHKVNREFRNSLQMAYENCKEKNHSFFWCIEYLNEILEKVDCKFAMLKGAYLCSYYPIGYRTSNDIDLLVLPDDITKVGNALSVAGFNQGYIKNNEFVPATRNEIIESKLMRGETVPYIKKVGLPGMKFLEVDINFSLDYKNGNTHTIDEVLNKSFKQKINHINVNTLAPNDFFIHLCSHLYKEATTLPWIEMKRDMTMYKYCDIYTLLEDMTKHQVKSLFCRAEELNMEKICAFAILQTSELFDIKNRLAIDLSKEQLKNNSDFLHTVISPREKKLYVYKEKDIFKRFFSDNRTNLLVEEEKYG